MPLGLMRKFFVVLLAVHPAICAATDTLDCSGETYSLQFHVGSEGVADFTLFEAEGVVAVGTRADLAVHMLEWANAGNGLSGNFIEVHTRDGFQVPFKIRAKGGEGRIVVKDVTAPIDCDWQR